MTAKQPPPHVAGTVERQERGLALADTLLESSRGMTPLTGAAHARVKRRLTASTRRRSFRRVGWLRPVVIVSLCLVCGAAFGIALDRVVLKRGADVMTAPSGDGGSPGRSRARLSRTPAKPIPTAAEQATADFDAVGVDLPPLPEVPQPTSSAEVPVSPETPSPTRSSNHARKLALRAQSADTLPVPSPSGGSALAPIAPAGVAAEWQNAEATTGPAPTSEQAPPANTGTLSLPAAPAAPPQNSALAKAPSNDGLSEERLLAAAIRALRAKTDPRSALAALDEYRKHYPHGRLFVEAEVLRVDALAALKNTTEVLHVLDGLDFAQMPGGLARQLQRAELRAAAGRYREAEADFDHVLMRGHSQDAEVLERALWGRAQSRAGLGDGTGARTDASEYVRRFPTGRFAAVAARMGSAVAP